MLDLAQGMCTARVHALHFRALTVHGGCSCIGQDAEAVLDDQGAEEDDGHGNHHIHGSIKGRLEAVAVPTTTTATAATIATTATIIAMASAFTAAAAAIAIAALGPAPAAGVAPTLAVVAVVTPTVVSAAIGSFNGDGIQTIH